MAEAFLSIFGQNMKILKKSRLSTDSRKLQTLALKCSRFKIIPRRNEFTAKFVVSRCAYCKLRRDFRFFCSVNYLSEGGVNANHNVTCSPSLAEDDASCSRIAKEMSMVSGFFVEGGMQTLLYSCK